MLNVPSAWNRAEKTPKARGVVGRVSCSVDARSRTAPDDATTKRPRRIVREPRIRATGNQWYSLALVTTLLASATIRIDVDVDGKLEQFASNIDVDLNFGGPLRGDREPRARRRQRGSFEWDGSMLRPGHVRTSAIVKNDDVHH
jgi:hypothetical protein